MNAGWTAILGIGGIIVAMLAAFAIYILWNKQRKRQRMLEKIRADWGAWPDREYDYYEWDAAMGYYTNKEQEEFQIDDITWGDLDMDRVFMLMNHTGSFLGEGYLYYLLRTPVFEEAELEERERLIRYFDSHTEQREKIQMFFRETGKAGRNSIFDAVYGLTQVQLVSNLHHFLVVGVFLASIGLLFISPQAGILAVIMAMMFTMLDYYKKKRPIEKYVLSCSFLLRTLRSAEELTKIDLPEIREYQEKIRRAIKDFGRLKRNTYFLMTGTRADADPLVGIIMYLNSCLHIDLIQFSTIVKEMQRHLPEFEILVEQMGKIESAIAIASFRKCMEDYCIPRLEKTGDKADSKKPFLETELLYHPLIQDPVKNSIRAERGVLLTGSNASGKSTFLKTVAVNAILAQTVHTCMAQKWESGYFRVFSSMALQDNLEGQESYYIVEIKSLKRILDRISTGEEQAPVLCFVDEVLRGTNTVERIAASSQVLRYMTGRQVLCFAATHDIELTHILENYYDNYHFQEEVQDNDIRFDYRLYEGRATSRNAIKLLEIIGYEKEVIREAESQAEYFLKTGEWAVQEEPI